MPRDRFLLPAMHIRCIMEQTDRAEVREALQSLPSGLAEGLDSTLKRIKNQPSAYSRLAMDVLMWLSHAKFQITVEGLQEALAVTIGTSQLNSDHIKPAKLIVSCCLGLVVEDKSVQLLQGNPTVRLVHLSVKEYLMERQSIFFPHCERRITRVCLTYLSLEYFQRGYCVTDEELAQRLSAFAFLWYAAYRWLSHAKEDPDEEIEDLCLQFLEQTQNIDFINQVFPEPADPRFYQRSEYGSTIIVPTKVDSLTFLDPLVKVKKERDKQIMSGTVHRTVQPGFCNWFPRNRTSLHMVARYGFTELVSRILAKGEIDPNAADSFGVTALMLASKNGHISVVQALLADQRTNPEAYNSEGGTALDFAAANNEVEIAEILLQRPEVDINSENYTGETALSLTAVYGDGSVTKLLLAKNNIDPNHFNDIMRTALWLAVNANNTPVVEALLAHEKIDPNLEDIYGNTPLAMAVEEGLYEMAEVLLKHHDINVNCQNRNGRTPLFLAVERGRVDMVDLLTKRDDLIEEVPDDSGCTPLLFACKSNDAPDELLQERRRAIILLIQDRCDLSPFWGQLLALKQGHNPFNQEEEDSGDSDNDLTKGVD
jgi:ankyrin repeat domain-containing protein 50